MSEKALRGLSEVLFYTALGLLLIQPLHAAWVTSGFNNLYAWQALSWKEGNTTVPGAMGDVTHWRGQAYCSFPPLPSLVLLPFVWLFGIEVRVVAVSVGLLLVGLRALWLLLPRLGCPPARRTWLLGGFVAGTAYLYCVRESGAVWFFAHVCAMATLLCAITETLGKARGWLIGLLLGLTFLSRQMTIAGLPFFFVALSTAHPTASLRRQAWVGLIAGLIPCIAAYLAYNQFRFDSLFETGYTHIAHEDFLAPRFAQGGLFHVRYLPFNAAYLFLQGPHFDFWGKERLSPSGPDFFGTALPLASPFLLAAFLAKAQDPTDRQRLTGAWVAILCILLPTLCYYNNGYTQVNVQRFTLDFLPFLLLPVARGLTRLPETLWRGFVLWSLWLNVLYWVVLPYYYSLG